MGVKDKTELDKADRVYRRWAGPRLANGSLPGRVAETKQRTVVGGGAVWLQPVQPRPGNDRRIQPYLLSMYTSPEFRGVGIATRIVREAIKWCRKAGYGELLLHGSKMGRRLYEHIGFKHTSEMRLDLKR